MGSGRAQILSPVKKSMPLHVYVLQASLAEHWLLSEQGMVVHGSFIWTVEPELVPGDSSAVERLGGRSTCGTRGRWDSLALGQMNAAAPVPA